MTAVESLVERFLGAFAGHRREGDDQWTNYIRVEDGLVEPMLASAIEAARRLGVTVYAAVVPDTYDDAPLRTLEGQTVLRIADTPAPWGP